MNKLWKQKNRRFRKVPKSSLRKKLQLQKRSSPTPKSLQGTMQRMTLTQYRATKLQQPRRSKFNNRRTEYNGRVYDSKKEAGRAAELDVLARVGAITSWSPQPEFKIEHRGVKICTYRGDFKVQYPDGHVEIEDVKGVRTSVYILKKKLVRAFYGIEIKEI